MSVRGAILGALALSAAQPAIAAAGDTSCAPKNLAALAPWEGVWAVEGIDAAAQGLSGRSGSADYKLIGLSAPWNERGWELMAAMLQRASLPDVKQGGWGFPMMMDSFSEFTFVISPRQTAVINQYREVRTIYTDERGHVPEEDAWPTNWGDSTGCWQGDTLVIDTVGVRFDPQFNIAAPPLSEKAHFVERIRMVAPDRLENEMTITDPTLLTAPWTVRLTYIPAGIDRLVLDAYDDRNDTAGQTITRSTREELKPQPLPSGVPLTEAQLEKFAGSYVLDGAPVEFQFERRGGRLFFQPPGLSGFMPMIATGPADFTPIAGGTFHFIADESGLVTGFEGEPPNGPPIKGRRKAT